MNLHIVYAFLFSFSPTIYVPRFCIRSLFLCGLTFGFGIATQASGLVLWRWDCTGIVVIGLGLFVCGFSLPDVLGSTRQD